MVQKDKCFDSIVKAAKKLSRAVDRLTFEQPVTHVYNPLRYAWKAHERYLALAAKTSGRVLMLGMNPGPWGMAQTGVPFGEISAVRDWMGIDVRIGKPKDEHPKRIVEGFDCPKSEVSGRRLWGLFQKKYPDAKDFFAEHFVSNYCPLVFMEQSARNRTPDKLSADERELLQPICDQHLATVIEVLDPEFLVGVGAYAEKCLKRVVQETNSAAQLTRILHPSPASPAANKNWGGNGYEAIEGSGHLVEVPVLNGHCKELTVGNRID